MFIQTLVLSKVLFDCFYTRSPTMCFGSLKPFRLENVEKWIHAEFTVTIIFLSLPSPLPRKIPKCLSFVETPLNWNKICTTLFKLKNVWWVIIESLVRSHNRTLDTSMPSRRPHNAYLNIPNINKNSEDLTASSVYVNFCKQEIAVQNFFKIAVQSKCPLSKVVEQYLNNIFKLKTPFLLRILVHVSL